MFGALLMYIDFLVRLFPGQSGFRIQNSDGFLSCSLSLSAGVMLFSALYKMLPSSKKSLQEGGSTSREAAWILILAFLGGVFGIQVFSKMLHRFMPSHAVDCDHDHGHGKGEEMRECEEENPAESHARKSSFQSDSEETPLLSRTQNDGRSMSFDGTERRKTFPVERGYQERPTLQSRVTATMASIVNNKTNCDVNGSCHGYTNPCGQDCFTKIQMRRGQRQWFQPQPKAKLSRTASTTMAGLDGANETTKIARIHDHTDLAPQTIRTQSEEGDVEAQQLHICDSHDIDREPQEPAHPETEAESHPSKQHHHHIPTNAFLSISLQTSIAIALHKLPESFITYATNHANPQLGVTVFLAIGIHNIGDGFALALPIFLASGSRFKALWLTFVLGGLSQPIGAGVAAIWLKVAERNRGSDAGEDLSDGVYGTMFAITAGIMASVALSLLQESFELSHNKNLCMVFTFVGMGIMGMSLALTA